MFEYIYLKDGVTRIDYYGHDGLFQRNIRFECSRKCLWIRLEFDTCRHDGYMLFKGVIAN